MSVWRVMVEKRTWLGIGTVLLTELLLLMLGALLTLRAVLPVDGAMTWCCVSWGVAACVGGRLALRGREEGRLPVVLAAAVGAYLLSQTAALALGGAAFSGGGLSLALCLLGGALLAGLLPTRLLPTRLPAGRRKKKRPAARKRRR